MGHARRFDDRGPGARAPGCRQQTLRHRRGAISHRAKEVLADLANAQSPYATVVGCSDSRVPPELVFDASFGELFHRARGRANTAASSARLYWENFRATFAALAAGKKPANLSVPVAFTVFPSEIFQAPRSWAEKVYPNLIYFNEAEKGGHFAAWEEPEIFARELRAAFSSLR
jgi:pimeloyl-ACP methyl ester carboxylesterase